MARFPSSRQPVGERIPPEPGECSGPLSAATEPCGRKSAQPSRTLSDDAGFTLVEVLIATLVLVVGLVSVAQLLAVSVVMNSDARSATSATQQAQTKIDELMKASFTTPAVQINAADTLSSNVANYFDTPAAGITRRWQVTAGPSNTRKVTVRVLASRGRLYGNKVEMTTIIRQW